MKIRFFVAVVFSMLSLNACANSVQVQVNVHDDEGRPVEGAKVKGAFNDLSGNTQFLPSMKDTTDTDGKAEISGDSVFHVPIWVNKNEYYESHLEIDGRQPGEIAVSVLLRQKRNPIPMYAKTTQILPVILGEEFGYDFQVGDYVTPHGKGVISDLVLEIRYKEEDFWNYDYYLSVRFSNPQDGLKPFLIQNTGSDFRSEYDAPVSGYLGEWDYKRISRKGEQDETNMDKRRNYFFRVRTVTDENGDIESAYYGKIYGEFPHITYYFNPAANDRNLEFDPERNVFQDLDVKEMARKP